MSSLITVLAHFTSVVDEPTGHIINIITFFDVSDVFISGCCSKHCTLSHDDSRAWKESVYPKDFNPQASNLKKVFKLLKS